jgi:peptidyl-prolyl cis-trans isomerase SurA
MKRLLLCTALVITMLLPAMQATARVLDEIVAIVEDDVVLRSELNSALRSNARRSGESTAEHEARVLDEMITTKAQQLAAKSSGIKVTDEEVDEALQTIASRNSITVGQMREILQRQGTSFSGFRESIRKQLEEQKFHQQALSSQVQVTDSEIDDYLSVYGQSTQMRTVNQAKVRHILLMPGEQLSNQDARARLTDIRQRILAGESFTDLARAYSDDTGSALQGGDLGWLSPGQATPEFERQLPNLQPGQLSQPFQTPFGWHIAEVTERRQHQSADESARTEARSKIQERKIQDSLELLSRRLRDQAYIEKRLDGYE